MIKEVSEELYVRFRKHRRKIYDDLPLSNPMDSPTEESFLRANMKTLKIRGNEFRNVMPEIVKFEKKDVKTRWTLLILAAITGLLSWGTYFLTQLIGFTPLAAVASAGVGTLIILNLISVERPFFFIHKPKDASPFRLQKLLEDDARASFRKTIKL